MITAVSRIFVALTITGYDANRPFVEFHETQAAVLAERLGWAGPEAGSTEESAPAGCGWPGASVPGPAT